MNYTSSGKKFFGDLLDYIWPRFCLGCKTEGTLFCTSCQTQLKLLPLEKLPWPENDFNFQACYVCLDYQSPVVQRLIKYYKYNYFENLAPTLVSILARQASLIGLDKKIIITNPPLHPSRYRLRGFDQTEQLAKGLAQAINIPYQPLLVRQKKTKAQAKLSREQRLKNVDQAFILNPKNQPTQDSFDHTILLIDDVATTGATLDQAAQTLKIAGFNKIICLVIAKN